MSNTVSPNENYPDITRSQELYERALNLIPAVTQTLAKGPGQHTKGVAPIYLQRGHGSHVWDVDGNEFIDYTMGVGPLSLGYCNPVVDAAIRRQLDDGITFSLMHPLEVEVAELMREVIPNAEAVRFSKTGADVTSAAVRAARAFTGKNKVLCCGYHGWHDWYIGVTDRINGIPQNIQDLSYTIPYNDIDTVEKSLQKDSDIACIILEPIVFEAPKDNFLQELRRLCTEHGVLLIFDEMWTGFRLALGGAQEYFGVKADLACFSKAVANGMPISMLTGRADVMEVFEQKVFFYTTFGGEALSLAAAQATISELRDKKVTDYLASQGKKLREGYNKIAQDLDISYTRCFGYDCRSIVVFDPEAGNPLEVKAFVQQEMIKNGILWGGFHNMCFAHSDADIEYTLSVYAKVLPMLKEAVEAGDLPSRLRGDALEAVFRKTSKFHTKPN